MEQLVYEIAKAALLSVFPEHESTINGPTLLQRRHYTRKHDCRAVPYLVQTPELQTAVCLDEGHVFVDVAWVFENSRQAKHGYWRASIGGIGSSAMFSPYMTPEVLLRNALAYYHNRDISLLLRDSCC